MVSQPTTSFTSIFDQLKQRQREEQDREKNASKAAEAAKAEEDAKKKKKKSVRWNQDLEKIKIIEWIEPEGEYYGGGSGALAEHGINGQLGEGAALKNKNQFDDDEPDLVDWYTPIRKFTAIPFLITSF